MFGTVCLAAAVQADCVWVLRGPLRCFLPFLRQQDVCRFSRVWRKEAQGSLGIEKTLSGVSFLLVLQCSLWSTDPAVFCSFSALSGSAFFSSLEVFTLRASSSWMLPPDVCHHLRPLHRWNLSYLSQISRWCTKNRFMPNKSWPYHIPLCVYSMQSWHLDEKNSSIWFLCLLCASSVLVALSWGFSPACSCSGSRRGCS